MKKSFAVSGLMITVAIGLSACEPKTSGEQFVDCVEQKTTRKEQNKCMEQIKPSEKERERMNEFRKQNQEAWDKVLGKKKGTEDSTEKK